MLHRFDPWFTGWEARPEMHPRNFMAADIYRQDDHYLVVIDAPGVTEDGIDITVEKKTLTVELDRPSLASEDLTAVSRNRAYGHFTRRFYLGDGLEPEGIEAGLADGILTITIPVVETAKARKIEVGTVRTAIES